MTVPWWQSAAVYQIYPRSFLDTNGDGVGDLGGIAAKLELPPRARRRGAVALADLPLADGRLRLRRQRPHETSTLSSATSPRSTGSSPRRTSAGCVCCWTGSPTTRARRTRGSASRVNRAVRASATGTSGAMAATAARPTTGAPRSAGPAWTFDERTEQWYLHLFLPEQPDLNWANTDVVEAQHDVLRFWLDRGVDGFRADVVHLIGKDVALPDQPDELAQLDLVGVHDHPRTHELLRGIRRVLDGYGDRAMVGEVQLGSPALLAPYYGRGNELDMVFDFALLRAPWDAQRWADVICKAEAAYAPVNGLAGLGALEPRHAAAADPVRRVGGAGARRRGRPADAARHAVPLRRRGAGPARRRRSARAAPRSWRPRRLPRTDPLGRRRPAWLAGEAVAPVAARGLDAERRCAAARRHRDAHALPPAAARAARHHRRCTPARGGSSTRPPGHSPTSARTRTTAAASLRTSAKQQLAGVLPGENWTTEVATTPGRDGTLWDGRLDPLEAVVLRPNE